MSLPLGSCSALLPSRAPSLRRTLSPRNCLSIERRSAGTSANGGSFSGVDLRSGHQGGWSFVGGSRIPYEPKASGFAQRKTVFRPTAICLTSAQIASNAFTWGTVSVLPFYTLMVVAPNAAVTKRTMESSLPYIALGVLYAYLLYLSWTPDTLRIMFASKYWLPELAGIARMFTNEITVASAWIHLLAVDLFAARGIQACARLIHLADQSCPMAFNESPHRSTRVNRGMETRDDFTVDDIDTRWPDHAAAYGDSSVSIPCTQPGRNRTREVRDRPSRYSMTV